MYMHVDSSIIHKGKRWKQLVFIINEWIYKLWHIHTMMYYSVIKRNEVLIYAAVWVNPENMLNEKRQTKGVTCMILFT